MRSIPKNHRPRLKLADLGEFGLIDRIKKKFPTQKNGSNLKIEVPIGDDAFVARFPTTKNLVFTTDTLIEGTHFDFNLMKPYLDLKNQYISVGHKAMAANLSDLAAMGRVKPLFFFVSLGLGGDISVDFVDYFYVGMSHFLKKCGYFLAGGDTFRADKSIISITLVGQQESGFIIRRNGAKIGDILMVSGPLGLSSCGLELMKRRIKSTFSEKLVHHHLYPKPQLEFGRILASKETLASSMMDSSDDLSTSLEILSRESKVGFEIDLQKIKIDPDLQRGAARLKKSPYEFMLYGGEDYQLIFTIHPSKVSQVQKKIPSAIVLGTVKPQSNGIKIRPFIKDCRFRHF
jgi:thiamine-monophosphate kinase